MLVEIHMLKNYPATNLNRDDSGAPKSCVFGGINRGRISSQCLKRSWRMSPYFQAQVGKACIGTRTRKLTDIVQAELELRGFEKEEIEPWMKVLKDIAHGEVKKSKDDKKEKEMQIILYSQEDVMAVVDAVKALLEEKKTAGEIKDIRGKMKKAAELPVSIDIALFGRMVTSESFRNVEASMQVAHAISTNKLSMESDYFTAMDDYLEAKGLQEAAHLNATDYDSCCYYIYASIDTEVLRENLALRDNADELTQKVIPALIGTMAFTNPGGKQNSFAGNVTPSAMLVECKNTKIPISYVNAYVAPAKATEKRDLVTDSAEKLVEECNRISRMFGVPVEKRLWLCDTATNAPTGAVDCEDLFQLIREVEAIMK